MNTEHKQISIFNPFYNEYIEVDEGISELLGVLWLLRIETSLSCEENKPGIVWIVFSSMDDYQRFLNTLANVDYGFYLNEIESSENWSASIWPWNLSEKIDEDKGEIVPTGPPEILCSVSVRFPKEMYPRILAMLKTFPVCGLLAGEIERLKESRG